MFLPEEKVRLQRAELDLLQGEAEAGRDKAPGSAVFEGLLYSAFLKAGVCVLPLALLVSLISM